MDELIIQVKSDCLPDEGLLLLDETGRRAVAFETCGLCGEVFTENITSENHSCDHFEDEFICELCGQDFETLMDLEQHGCQWKKENCPAESIKPKQLEKSGQIQSDVLSDVKDICGNTNRFEENSKPYQVNGKLVCDEPSKPTPVLDGQLLKTVPAPEHDDLIPKKSKEALAANMSLQNSAITGKTKPNHFCQECGATFSSFEMAKNHRCDCVEGNIFSCKECHKEFTTNGALLKHEAFYRKGNLTCPTCLKSFELGCLLKMHKCSSASKKESSFVCTHCNRSFDNERGLKLHRLVHTKRRKMQRKDQPYECKICGTRFTLKDSLRIHMARHTGELEFICGYCGFGFATKTRLKYHMRIHTGEKPHKCDTCGRTFSRLSHLKSHIPTHTGERPFMCVGCGKRFINRSDLKAHLRFHTGEKPFVCETCGKSFHFSGSLTKHVQTHQLVRKFACDLCDMSFATRTGLTTHSYTHSGLKPYPCDLCEKRFATKYVRNAHREKCQNGFGQRQLMSGKELYSCGSCGTTCESADELRSHVETHEGINPYMCSECGKCFNQKACLTRHMLTHRPDASTKLSCQYCGRMFSSKFSLNRHIQLHTGEKPFICDICDKSFTKNYVLQYHRRTQHIVDGEGEEYSCHICQAQFFRVSMLHEHLQTHVNYDSAVCD